MFTRPVPADSPARAPRPGYAALHAPRGKVRVLFATAGWPSGMIDVASWAGHAGLAETVVFQIQPGFAFRLDAEGRQFLRPGAVHPETAESFARAGRRLAPGARVRRGRGAAWEIDDSGSGSTYRLIPTQDGLEVVVPENLDDEPLRRRLADWFAARTGRDRCFQPDGSPTAAVRDALLAAGRQFLLKLLDWKPNYVFAGEAEEPFLQFLRLAWQPNSKDLQAEIPGLAYRHGGRIFHNTLPQDGYERCRLDVDRSLCGTERRRLENLRRPVADLRVLEANRLDWSMLEGFRRPFDSLYFTAGRGCPAACTFCSRLHGQRVRVKSAPQLLEEIEAADRLAAAGEIRLTRWKLFEHTDDAELAEKLVGWAAVYDEDFFLHPQRAIDFFRLWDQSPLKHRYRLSVQTNPCSLLASNGGMRGDLLEWIERLKPMVQLGAESFHPELLARWRKRHTRDQLHRVLDALDGTRQDYTVFQLLTDFETTPEELVETLRRLALAAYRRRRMRIAASPFTIPLYDSQTRRLLEYGGRLDGDRIGHFTDFERPQPGWMDPLAAELADLADAQLQFALNLPQRDGALYAALEAMLERIRQEDERALAAGEPERRKRRLAELAVQAERAMGEIKQARFRAVPLPGR